MAVTLEQFAFAIYGRKRREAARRALRSESEGVTRAGLVAAAEWAGLTDDAMEQADLQRLLDAVVEHVEAFAPDAPSANKDFWATQYGAYVHDTGGRPSVAAFRSSGAAAGLESWQARPGVVLA